MEGQDVLRGGQVIKKITISKPEGGRKGKRGRNSLARPRKG